MKQFILFSILAITFLNISAQYNSATSDIEKVINSRPVAGVSVAVVKNNRIVYTHSFGLKNIEEQTPLTDKDIFRIASISKSFSTTALMQLVQQKRLKLEDDVSNLIGFKIGNPAFPDKVITLRMILSHTSSINDSQGYFTLDAINPDKNPDWEKCYSNYAPGTQYSYCNLNYNLAGTIVERVSGERFDHYIYNHILKPLNIYGGFNVNELDSSLFVRLYDYNSDSSTFVYSPTAYAPRKKEISEYVLGYSTPIFSPAGGLKVSATGLARYMMMHMNKGKLNGVRIISSKSEKIIRKPISKDANYGLGLLTTQKLIPGKTLVGHTGGAYGLSSAMFFDPGKKFGIVVISNGCAPGYTDGYNTIVKDIVNILYREVVAADE